MRKLSLLAVVAVLGIGSGAWAQESYTISATAVQVARTDRERIANNVRTCVRLGQAPGCTQAQACVAAGAAGGAGCTFAQALAVNAELYANSLAGREAFVAFTIYRLALSDYAARHQRADAGSYCTWWSTTATQAQKDSECSKVGQAAGCSICP